MPIFFNNCTANKTLLNECNIHEVYVESGNIKETNFSKNASPGFSISDNAMGRISPIIGPKRIDLKSDCPPNNAYQDKQGYVYIFKENNIPEDIKKMPENILCGVFSKAKWTLAKTYQLDYDAEICVDQLNSTIYMREKGDYPIYTATIKNHTIYKYYNRFIVEDYKNFLRFHEYLRPNMPSENLFARIDLDQNKFTMRYNSVRIPSGKLDYKTLEPTASEATDKIYFESIRPSNFSYRIQHIYLKHSDETLKEYFCLNQSNCNLDLVTQVNCEFQRDENIFTNENSNNKWFDYLNKKIFPSYLEKTIKGFECDCKNKMFNPYPKSQKSFKKMKYLILEPLDSPPLPATSNGRAK
jgi:hypothetical protein